MNWYDWVSWILVFVGALNWGLVGVFDWNLVETILGTSSVTRVIYTLVGLAALYELYKVASKK
jgi:uncharacterized membrane protein YuzA (DUF378 family)